MDFNHSLSLDSIPYIFSGITDEEYNLLEDEVKLYGMYLVRGGTLENLEKIDDLISKFSLNRPLERIDIVDRDILRMSVFCLMFGGDIHPPHIIIDEAVKLSQDFSTEVNYKFINGILDAMQKQLFQFRSNILMIRLKNEAQIARIREACHLTAELMHNLSSFIEEGMSTFDIDQYCYQFIVAHKGFLHFFIMKVFQLPPVFQSMRR